MFRSSFSFFGLAAASMLHLSFCLLKEWGKCSRAQLLGKPLFAPVRKREVALLAVQKKSFEGYRPSDFTSFKNFIGNLKDV
jgi:hypothetical protein